MHKDRTGQNTAIPSSISLGPYGRIIYHRTVIQLLHMQQYRPSGKTMSHCQMLEVQRFGSKTVQQKACAACHTFFTCPHCYANKARAQKQPGLPPTHQQPPGLLSDEQPDTPPVQQQHQPPAPPDHISFLSVATWNARGIQTMSLRKDKTEYLLNTDSDILCTQELRLNMNNDAEDGEKYRVINLYTAPDARKKVQLFKRLRELLLVGFTIILCGDFNTVTDENDRCSTIAFKLSPEGLTLKPKLVSIGFMCLHILMYLIILRFSATSLITS
ncbi:hypothetical protein ABVT39_022165 [Epinephelus coioides]